MSLMICQSCRNLMIRSHIRHPATPNNWRFVLRLLIEWHIRRGFGKKKVAKKLTY